MRLKGGTCFCCGEEAEAVWHAGQSVAVCRGCAVSTLPALIADAVWAPAGRGAIGWFDRAWKDAERAFWRAAACRLAHGDKPAEGR